MLIQHLRTSSIIKCIVIFIYYIILYYIIDKNNIIIAISILVVTMFIMISFNTAPLNNINRIDEKTASNNNTDKYVKINNITFMHNYAVSKSGAINFNSINKTSINSIYSYKDNASNNNITPYKSNYIKTNSTNYLVQYYNNSNIRYSIAFTERFNNYKVEIADIISGNNSKNTSYIYANIVPINSSKILLGNEFNINYKSSYGNQMKTLINSIELISMNYMGSSNNTMHKFGIEYGSIALAMGNMLKDTNNNIKNTTINKTESIIIDWNWGCINAIVWAVIAFLGILAVIAAFASAPFTGGVSAVAGLFFLAGLGLSFASFGDTIYNVGNACFGGW